MKYVVMKRLQQLMLLCEYSVLSASNIFLVNIYVWLNKFRPNTGVV